MSTKRPIRVAVTGAAGNLAYSLLFRIAAGEMLGLDQPVILQLLDLPSDKTQQALRGVALELDDCALPLLHEVVVTSDPFVAFRDASHVLLVGSMPRGPGMERADLLHANGQIFVEQGRIIDEVAGDDVRVVVVGNPCNTNCMIAADQARRLPKTRFTALMRLDQNRAKVQLARRADVGVNEVSHIYTYGNHSPSVFADFTHATIAGRPALEVIRDEAWLSETFLSTVGKRGAEIIQARGSSSAASAASAVLDHVRDSTRPGAVHSMAVQSEGQYGFSQGLWAGVPVRTTQDGYEVVRDYTMDERSTAKLAVTNRELASEREIVNELLRAHAGDRRHGPQLRT